MEDARYVRRGALWGTGAPRFVSVDNGGGVSTHAARHMEGFGRFGAVCP